MADSIRLEPLSRNDEGAVVALIQRTLEPFEEAGTVLASTFRRLEKFCDVYERDGSTFIIAIDADRNACIGGAGLGPLAGLPPSEGVGEVRDLVLEESYRGRGLGTRLLQRCLEEAKLRGYHRIYLETTPQMENAQRLFKRFGFRPVTAGVGVNAPSAEQGETLPCYFVLENLAATELEK